MIVKKGIIIGALCISFTLIPLSSFAQDFNNNDIDHSFKTLKERNNNHMLDMAQRHQDQTNFSLKRQEQSMLTQARDRRQVEQLHRELSRDKARANTLNQSLASTLDLSIDKDINKTIKLASTQERRQEKKVREDERLAKKREALAQARVKALAKK